MQPGCLALAQIVYLVRDSPENLTPRASVYYTRMGGQGCAPACPRLEDVVDWRAFGSL